jgi:osmotically-inducible protein OsmY
MRTDEQIKQDVADELKWEPSVKQERIGIAVKDGVVTLSDHVDSYLEKIAAERAALRISGVRAVVQEIEVKLPPSLQRTDEDIARAAVSALELNMCIPGDDVKVKVHNGWITLSGEVDWQYQLDAAEDAVCCLMGVKGVTNLITVKPLIKDSDIKTGIESAFQRNAVLDARRITVDTSGDKVVLKGTVHSFAEKSEAEQVARAAPGVSGVENNLMIRITRDEQGE